MISCKLDHNSVVSSRLTRTIPYDLSYDYLKLIIKSDHKLCSTVLEKVL